MAIITDAHFEDTYIGWTTAFLESFKTKRRGVSVTRYRWTANGHTCGLAPGGFPTVLAACAGVQNNKRFANVHLPAYEPAN